VLRDAMDIYLKSLVGMNDFEALVAKQGLEAKTVLNLQSQIIQNTPIGSGD